MPDKDLSKLAIDKSKAASQRRRGRRRYSWLLALILIVVAGLFFSGVFTADYEVTGRKFRLFIIEATDKDACKEIVQKYLRQTKTPDREVNEGRYTIADPHHGTVDLYWKGRYIWGAVDLADAELRSKYLKRIEEKMRDGK